MRRVAIIGCGGAGKSTLSLELGPLLDLPVVHIDGRSWRESTSQPDEEWPEIHRRLSAGEHWIIEGMKPGVLADRLARADAVVFLDLTRRTCLRGVVERRISFRRSPRPDTGRADRLTWPYLRWVLTFPRNVRPAVLEALGKCSCEIVTLRSRREIDGYARELRTTQSAVRRSRRAAAEVGALP